MKLSIKQAEHPLETNKWIHFSLDQTTFDATDTNKDDEISLKEVIDAVLLYIKGGGKLSEGKQHKQLDQITPNGTKFAVTIQRPTYYMFQC